MAILSAPQCHGYFLVALVRYLGQRGPTATDELAAVHCPISADASGPPAIYSDTLRVGRTLGVITGVKVLETPIGEATADERTTLLSWIFRQEATGEDLFADKALGATDLIRGLCWVLTQDPCGPPLQLSTLDDLQRGEGMPSFAIKNPVQYRAVVRWATWLGLAQPVDESGGSIVPDLRSHARKVLAARGPGVFAVDDFVSDLADRVPAAEGGWARERFDGSVGTPTQGSRLGPVISHALESLEYVGAIALVAPQDAAIVDVAERHLHGSGRAVSFVEVLA
jgi:hypothetical protein